jgi:hypothetical protein
MNKNLIIIYHLFQAHNWEQLFSEQIGLLFMSGLMDNARLIISVNGSSPLPPISYETIYRKEGASEKPSLLLARRYAEEFPDSQILYFHSKGISHPSNNQNDWRMMMQHFLIIKWRKAIKLLDDHDAVGVNWRLGGMNQGNGMVEVPHFSGNYWWANASFLKKLDPMFLDDHYRMTHEFWIGSVTGKIANLHETNLDHYNQACPSSHYCSSYFVS